MSSNLENRKLSNMKNNIKKKNKRENTKTNMPYSGLYLFVELIKQQNYKILSEIAKDKMRSKTEREDFISRFNKINYQIPEVIDNQELEINQEIYP
tara:strand:- start:979 stop:1266 length:288 start_codon:yes stop_codon:yes gene_type:complete